MKKNKGITIVALVITVILMSIIIGTTVYNVSDKTDIDELEKMYVDIEKIKDKVSLYNVQYNILPTKGERISISTYIDDINQINPNDDDEYYELDLSKLPNLTINYGTGEYGDNDKYIINKKTQTIYYLQGIEYEGKNYYALNIDYKKLYSE